jgi:hypothetical protein
MRLLLKLFTIVSFLAASGLGVALLRIVEEPAAVTAPESTEARGVVSEPGPALAPRLPQLALDAAVEVTLDVDRVTMQQLTARQRHDQMLDWLLVTVVSSSDPEADVLNRTFADMPILRHGYIKPLGVLEFGDTRARMTGDGTIIALVPAGVSPEARKDYIAHIADDFRKDQGGRVATIRQVDYQLDDASGRAVVTRRADVSGEEVQSAAYGYHSAVVVNREQLLSFLARIDDLIYAKPQHGAVELCGRKILSRKYRGIGIEHIATIWQAEMKLLAEQKAWEDFYKPLVTDFNNWWSAQTYRDKFERLALEHKREAEWAELETRIAEEAKKHKLIDHTGFSLDPDYFFEGLTKEAELIQKAFVVTGFDIAESRRITEGFERRDIVPLLLFREKLKEFIDREPDRRKILLFTYLSEIEQSNRFQAARYDGDLAGTEVGMILYYTDLLAKMWVLNYGSSAPTKLVRDFMSGLTVPVSIAYRTESELYPHARLWFGTSNLGYQRTSAGEMLFQRLATRIYSAGSNPLDPGKEVQTSVALGAPIDWWNDHYEEVERVEPEYQRLNQIMKWSVTIGWLLRDGRAASWDFLAAEPVNRSLWFPDWVKTQPELVFKGWNTIEFFPRGAMGTKTEALPMLRSESFSQFGQDGYLYGGVSLARSSEIAKHAPISTEFPALSRRSNIDYSASSMRGAIKTYEGLTYSVTKTPRGALATLKAATDTKLRGTFAQLRNGTFEREVMASGDGGVALAMRLDGQPIGQLGIQRSGNGFRVSWEAQDLEAGIALARKVSTANDLGVALRNAEEVEWAFAIPGKKQYVVKIAGNRRWTLLHAEEQPAPTLASNAHARAGEVDRGASIEVTSVDANDARRLTAAARPLRGENAPGATPSRGGDPLEITATKLEEALGQQKLADAGDILANMRGDLAQKLMQERVVHGLLITQELVRQGNIAKAIHHVDGLIAAHGPLPDLAFTKASLLLERGETDLAAAALNKMTRVQMRTPQNFYDEIAARLGGRRSRVLGGPDLGPPLNALERQNFETVRDIATLHQRVAASRDLGAAPELIPYATKGRLEIGWKVEPGKSGQTLKASETQVVGPDAVIYIQDNPALSNIDWSVPLSEAMRRPVMGAKVLRYSDEKLATFRPAEVFSADGQRSYRLREGTPKSSGREWAWQGARTPGQAGQPQAAVPDPCPSVPSISRPPADDCALDALASDRQVYVVVIDDAAP